MEAQVELAKVRYAKSSALIIGLLCIWQISPLLAQTPTPTPTQPPLAVYVSDNAFRGVLKFNAAGEVTIFTSGISGATTGLAFDNAGNLYVSIWGGSGDMARIEKYDPSGGMSIFTSSGYLCQPVGLAFDDNGVLYVSNACYNTIIKCDSAGQQTVFASSPLNVSGGLAFDRIGNLYVANPNGDAIYKFDTSGNPTLFANTGGNSPSGLAFDKGGNLYVATLQNNTILKFDSAGHGTLFATTNGSYPNPYGIAFDTEGYLYVATGHGNTIQKFNSTGQGSVFAPGMGFPYFIAIQPSAIPTHEYVSGNISYCSNPSPVPVPNVTLTLTVETMTSATTDSVGNYQFSSLAAGGSYTVTPTKSALPPGSAGINTVDVVATQRHFLNIAPLTGCRLTAADVNGGGGINTLDVVLIQRFFLGDPGTANVGKYQFTPANRTYSDVVADQIAQNYDALVFGDVASPFAERPGGLSEDAADGRMSVSDKAKVGAVVQTHTNEEPSK